MTPNVGFWDNIAEKYRASAISDEAAYAYTLERVASYLKATDQVLELGCGTGNTALKLAPFAGHITATDFSRGMIDQARQRDGADNVTFRVADIHDGGFEPDSFDAVLGFNLFHLVSDFEAQVARAFDLLKPGGVFISKMPCLSDPSAKLHFRLLLWAIPLMQLVGKAPFVKFRTIAEMHEVIEARGFTIVETGNYPVQPPSHFVVARKG